MRHPFGEWVFLFLSPDDKGINVRLRECRLVDNEKRTRVEKGFFAVRGAGCYP